jgi:hypothetical protein
MTILFGFSYMAYETSIVPLVAKTFFAILSANAVIRMCWQGYRPWCWSGWRATVSPVMAIPVMAIPVMPAMAVVEAAIHVMVAMMTTVTESRLPKNLKQTVAARMTASVK